MIARDKHLEAAARAAFDEHEGPQEPPPPPPSERRVRSFPSVAAMCDAEDRKRALRAKIADILGPGEWLGSVA